MFFPKNAKVALSLLEGDESMLLGLAIGSHKRVLPGDFIPRAGESPAQ